MDATLVSIPMFIFMGSILERSGSAASMLRATEILLKRCPGGLAVSVMVMGTILAAPIGVVGAAVVLLSIISLKPMLVSGYHKQLAIGTIGAAGTLGILIPPAIMLVVMAEKLNTNAGALFFAATMPSFLLSGIYLVYIIGIGIFRPDWAPKMPADYGPQSRAEFWETMWKGLFPMTFLMILIFLLVFPFEWIEICLIVLPIFGPILMKYDFSDHLGGGTNYLICWFATLVAVNLQTAFMSPPFGATLFYMKGTAPPEMNMSDVYRGMYPFVGMQIVGLLLCIWFPGIVLWLPQVAGLLD